jgi:integrase/recombinase XerC
VLKVKFSVACREKTAVEKAFTDFLRYLRVERNYSDHTVRNYQSDLRQFVGFMRQRGKQIEGEDNTPLVPGQIDHLDIRAYLASLYRRNAKSSVARKLSTLRSFFGYLVRQAEIKQNPADMVSAPKMGKPIPDFLQVDEAFQLMHGPDTITCLGVVTGLFWKFFTHVG